MEISDVTQVGHSTSSTLDFGSQMLVLSWLILLSANLVVGNIPATYMTRVAHWSLVQVDYLLSINTLIHSVFQCSR